MNKRIALFIFLFLLGPLCFGQNSDQELKHYLSQFQTLKAQFHQTIIGSDHTAVLQESFGQVIIARPGKFYWRVDNPLNQLMVSDGKTLWISDIDLRQVTIRKLNQNSDQLPMLLLTDAHIDLAKTFSVEKLPQNTSSINQSDEVSVFKLTPKTKESTFQYVILTFKNTALSQMILFNSLGQKTQIDFSDVQINSSIDDFLFNFQVPKGFEIIKM